MQKSLGRGGSHHDASGNLDGFLGNTGKGVEIEPKIKEDFLGGHGATTEIGKMNRSRLR